MQVLASRAYTQSNSPPKTTLQTKTFRNIASDSTLENLKPRTTEAQAMMAYPSISQGATTYDTLFNR